jgi:hypothetical protein
MLGTVHHRGLLTANPRPLLKATGLFFRLISDPVDSHDIKSNVAAKQCATSQRK